MPYSPNVREWVFSEVAPALLTLHTGHVDQRGGTDESRPIVERR
jgi:hypothetical protein